MCFGLITSCGPQSEKSLLQEAQLCLNEATADQARNCVSKISNITTPGAYKLRCSAIFISEGFGGAAELVKNLDLIESGGSCTNCSTMVPLMTVFSFNKNRTDSDSRSINIATSEEAVSECTQAGSKGYYQVSQLFRMGTLAQMEAYEKGGVAPSTIPNESDIQAAIDRITPEVLGEIALSTYRFTCNQTTNPSETMKSICKDFNDAIGTNIDSPELVGECLKKKLKDTKRGC